MSLLYDWIRSLVSYMILMTMVMNLLPDRKYEKYLRLFVGVIFLILVFSPLTDADTMAEQVTAAFERITFQTESKLLKEEIEQADEARMERLVLEYQRAADENRENQTGENYGVEKGNVEIIFETE